MSLITYQNVRPWARAIKNKVVAREMPPWGASPASMKLANDRSLSQKDIDTIVRWADGGAPKGDDKDLPAVPDVPRRRLGLRRAGRGRRSADRSAGAADRRVPAAVLLREVAVSDRRVDPEDAGAHEQSGHRAPRDAVHPDAARRHRDQGRTPGAEGRRDVTGQLRGRHQHGPAAGQLARASGWSRTCPGRGWEALRRRRRAAAAEGRVHRDEHALPAVRQAREGARAVRHLVLEGPGRARNAERVDARSRHDDGRRQAAAERAHSEHSAGRGQLEDHELQDLPGAGDALRHVPAHAPARQGHEVHPDVSGRPRGAGARRAEVRLQLAAVLRARHAAEDSGRQQADRHRALRQLVEEQVEPGAGPRGVLVRAELGRDVQPADPLDVGSRRNRTRRTRLSPVCHESRGTETSAKGVRAFVATCVVVKGSVRRRAV